MTTNLDLARECGAWICVLGVKPCAIFDYPTLDAFVERIRADERAACVSKSAESETQAGLSIADGTQAERDVLLAPVDFPPHPEIIARWKLGYERYEKARRLNSLQWGALCQRNLAGERFDDLIDTLPLTYSARIINEDLAQLHANGAKAWADVPDAAAWVDELRGGPERKPLTADDLWNNAGVMSLNAELGLPMSQLMQFAKAIEQAHGITGESS